MSLRSTTIDQDPPPARTRAATRDARRATASARGADVCFWAGHSGRLYRFTVHTLVECHMPARGAYVLVKRGAKGPKAKFIGVAASSAPTVNLARIRRRGAMLGADEVHIIALTGSTAELRRIVRDLRAGSDLSLTRR